jgi:hypothetical protein
MLDLPTVQRLNYWHSDVRSIHRIYLNSMPVQIACPKCSKQYKLPDSVLGKAVKCKQCGTAFRTKAPGAKPSASPAQAKRPAAPAKQNLSEFGIDDDFQQQPDLFGAPLPSQQASAGLGNFAAEDPGFGGEAISTQRSPSKPANSGGDENPYQSVLTNPALRSIKKNAGRSGGSATPVVGAIGGAAKIMGYLFIVFGSIGVIGLLGSAILLISSGLPAEEAEPDAMLYALAGCGIVGIGSFLLAMIMGLVFWAIAHGNTTTLGARDQVFSPGWMIGCWFVPFANLIWPYQGMAETYQASVKPHGTKWKNVPVPAIFGGTWAVFIIISIVDRILDKTAENVDARTVDFFLAGQATMWALSVVLFIFLVLAVIKAQYGHQSS